MPKFLKSNLKPFELQTGFSQSEEYKDAVRRFLLDRVYRNLTTNSITGYRAYLKALGQDFEKWGVSHLEILPSDLTHRMINNMMDHGYKEATINGRIRTCQQFYKFLFEEGLTEINLASTLKPIKATQATIHTFSKEQAILQQPKLDTFTGLRDYTIMLTFLDTGMRVCEMANLKLPDIDFEQQNIKIISGKGRKSRLVPIQKTCLTQIQSYIKERGNQKFDDLWISVFNKPFARFSIIDMISTHYKKANIQGVQGACHTLRHTMAKFFFVKWWRSFYSSIYSGTCLT